VPLYTFSLFLHRSYAFSASPILSPLPPSHTRSLSSSIAYAFFLTFPLLTICYTYRSRSPIAFSVSPILSLSPSIAYAFFLTFPLLTIFCTYRSRSLHCVLCFTHSLSPSIAYAFSLMFPLLTIFYIYRSRSLRCVLSSSFVLGLFGVFKRFLLFFWRSFCVRTAVFVIFNTLSVVRFVVRRCLYCCSNPSLNPALLVNKRYTVRVVGRIIARVESTNVAFHRLVNIVTRDVINETVGVGVHYFTFVTERTVTHSRDEVRTNTSWSRMHIPT